MLLLFRQRGVGRRHRLLEVGGACYRVDRAAEFHQEGIADLLEDATLMLGDHRFEHVLPAGFQRREGARFVALHQPAVADHIGREDRGEPTLDALFGHLRIKCGFG